MPETSPGVCIADRYQLQEKLGQGGMGIVWRAMDILLGRPVAIKEVRPPPTLPEDELTAMRARMMREARAAARLNHPGAVTVFDVLQDDGRTFIVMELVEAPTLTQVVRTLGPVGPKRAAEIALQLLDTLQAAHEAGIVHRDVKPANVMLARGRHVKLADFGLASLKGDPRITTTGLVIGSPAYMAPEQASGQPSGPPADLWALGVTMHFAVEGESPFDRGSSIPTLSAVLREEPRLGKRLGALRPVIVGLLVKAPEGRTGADELRDQLERVVHAADEPTSAQPLPPPAGQATGATSAIPPGGPVAVLDRASMARALEPDERDLTPAAPFPTVAVPAITGGLAAGRRRSSTKRVFGVVLAVATVAVLGAAGSLASRNNELPWQHPPTSASPPPATAPQATPSSQPAGNGGQRAGAVPDGWQTFTRDAVFALAYPPGWRVATEQDGRVRFEDPAGPGRFRVQPNVLIDPLALARETESGFASKPSSHDYRLLDLYPTRFKARFRAAVWEWTYTSPADQRRRHDIDLFFETGTITYAVQFETADAKWKASQKLLVEFLNAFTPLP